REPPLIKENSFCLKQLNGISIVILIDPLETRGKFSVVTKNPMGVGQPVGPDVVSNWLRTSANSTCQIAVTSPASGGKRRKKLAESSPHRSDGCISLMEWAGPCRNDLVGQLLTSSCDLLRTPVFVTGDTRAVSETRLRHFCPLPFELTV